MKENQKFPEPIITPTTKAEIGEHDADISKEEILAQGLATPEEYAVLEKYTMALFKRGTEIAAERGLILVDTKYEFGKHDGKIYLMDEIHTPDSSRYFYSEGYEERFAKGEPQKQLSKEFVREWLMDNGGVVKNIEFSTKAEYDAYVQGVSDAHLWDDYHILPNADEEPQPEVTIWMRLGVTVHGNKDDIENIIQGDSATLNRLLKRRSFDIDGEAYIPASVIEEYNKENQTDFDEEDIDFPTTYISQ